MTLIQARNIFRSQLASLYGQGEVDDLFKRLIRHLFAWESIKIALEPDTFLTPKESDEIMTSLQSLQDAVPLQYVLGQCHFFGLDFYVSPHVLIPRPETEELVEWILEEKEEPLNLMDIGTGSGCIALALKHQRPVWKIKGLDVSIKALEMAKKNADFHALRVDFLKYDILSEPIETIQKQDILVSNPPYVLPSERNKMHPNVLKHEPETALFVPEEDPLLFYKAILKKAKAILKPKGRIYFEINPLCCDALVELSQKEGYTSVTVKQDIFQKKRMLKMTLDT